MRLDSLVGPTNSPELYERDEYAVPATWPMEFEIGGGLEPISGNYHLQAWLAPSAGTTEAPAGAPDAAMDLQVTCRDDGCTTIDNVVLTLAP